ncbi:MULTISPECIES: hypothetical protein [unclassified Rhizobacter]|uniref:hypothetical protein n=1 Tax=unclassified Rhizobacter TaxID=2640088 RepID=UPI0006F91F2C|nr:MULTISPECIES: hypothetical protein [unclassified Rhizobacter]KQU65994.1 hypothetical protein ASC88_10450 [Rhizobacter sp. Root29]KQV97865.1 hypothetical protein ASC98_11200 [Rhizobacter sp. Root1238]KRB18748.1 hypothetical protein ASE08_05850 [Rhizobacter sp. Root16D2]
MAHWTASDIPSQRGRTAVAARGALPTLFAATAPQAEGGFYYGPDRLGETRGHPAAARIPIQALDRKDAQRLWDESARLTGVRF